MIVYVSKSHTQIKNLNIMYSLILNYMVFDIWKLKLTVD